MDTYRTMMISSQARRVHSRRVDLRAEAHRPLPLPGQLAVGALLTLSLAATYVAKAIFNADGAVSVPAVALALAALVTAGLVAGGGWRLPGAVAESHAARKHRTAGPGPRPDAVGRP